jgi:hypothetical protein
LLWCSARRQRNNRARRIASSGDAIVRKNALTGDDSGEGLTSDDAREALTGDDAGVMLD